MLLRLTLIGCIFSSACSFFVCGVATAQQDGSPSRPAPPRAVAVTPLMQMKLERAKNILEALTIEDLDKLARNARSLKLLSLESGWNVIQSEEYMMHSRDFQRAADMITEAAEEKDVHRAALGYVSLTVRCVECHSYMRKRQTEISRRD